MSDPPDDRPPDPVPEPPDLDLTFDAFEATDPLGGGGTADVFRATVDGHDREIAVKQPRATTTVDAAVVEGFIEEAETWARLDDHRAVVTVLGWGDGSHSDAVLPWLAMEYMDGGDLRGRVGDTPLREGLWIAREVTDAVWHAHRQGRTHHDLKPANVLFRAVTGAWDAPKVADWELSRALIEHTTGVDGLTPRYAAPEQLRPERFDGPDERTDIYQLGTLVYELLTGEHPFETGTGMGLAYAILEDDLRLPTAVDPSLPARVDDVLLPALARDPADRYEASLDLRRALTEALETVDAGTDGGAGATTDGEEQPTAAGGSPETAPATETTEAEPERDTRTDPEPATGPDRSTEADPEPDAGDGPGADADLGAVLDAHGDGAAYREAAAGELAALLDRVERADPATALGRVAREHDGSDRLPEPVLRDCYPWLFETVDAAAGRTYQAATEARD